jgi:hypothetical protein
LVIGAGGTAELVVLVDAAAVDVDGASKMISAALWRCNT